MSVAYASAPAVALVATQCAVCARPLVDALSVEGGIGPECRRKYGYDSADTDADIVTAWKIMTAIGVPPAGGEAPVRMANRLVARIALHQTGPDAQQATIAVYALGYRSLAGRIAHRIGAVFVSTSETGFYVRAPYSEAFAGLHVGQYDGATKVRTVAAADKARLWRALVASFPAYLLVSEKGMSVIPKEVKR